MTRQLIIRLMAFLGADIHHQRPCCNAENEWVFLDNINDFYTGIAPDLGTYEIGIPLPRYGPRTVSNHNTTVPVIFPQLLAPKTD